MLFIAHPDKEITKKKSSTTRSQSLPYFEKHSPVFVEGMVLSLFEGMEYHFIEAASRNYVKFQTVSIEAHVLKNKLRCKQAHLRASFLVEKHVVLMFYGHPALGNM